MPSPQERYFSLALEDIRNIGILPQKKNTYIQNLTIRLVNKKIVLVQKCQHFGIPAKFSLQKIKGWRKFTNLPAL